MHFLTTDVSEASQAVRDGWIFEGVACYVFTSSQPNAAQLQRLVHPDGDHFYTIDPEEALNAIAQFGYKEEGVACFAFPAQQPNTTAFFRRLNPSTGEHFYTASADEATAVLNEGFTDEGTACFVYVAGSAPGNAVPLYRLAR